ncbi:MAG: ABC transporter ATP-binding protein [Candidatus Nanoarchaeia archaeon]|jgi:ABC-2 type transport system ATP-binding protein
MIKVVGLSKSYNAHLAVDNISFNVKDGEVFGFLGPNGAGKTTTMRLLCCLLKPTNGTATIGGHDVLTEPEKIRPLIGLLPENHGLYEALSVKKNLMFHAQLQGINESKAEARMKHYLSMVDLWDRRDDLTGELSKGMKQKVAITRALLHEPKYLFLDEPTAGLDPQASKIIRELILSLKAKNRVIFINTHNLPEAQRICDRVAVLDKNVISIGRPSDLEHSLFKSRLMIELTKLSPRIISALKGYDYKRQGNKLIVTINKPEKDNPLIISKLVRAGASIKYASEESASLEDIYLKLIGDNR